jgi:peptidoglycan/xylan/chitin deacetylase (PgdA/CDA1 family)
MLKSGRVELASHTVTHPILMNLPDKDLDFELQHSKKELENFSGRRIHSFCYPNGLPGDYDERTKLAVNRAGYSMAFSSSEGINYKGSTEWNQLKRIHIHRTLPTFKMSASGLTEVINRLKNN